MPLSCKTFQVTSYVCANCDQLQRKDWGYECDVCGILACYSCFHELAEFRLAHEHNQAKPVSDPVVLGNVLVQDAQLIASIEPASSSSSTKGACPNLSKQSAPDRPDDTRSDIPAATRCPSCGWDRNASSLDSKLGTLQRNGRPFNAYELNAVSAPGRDAHSVVSQHMLRTVTHEFLAQFRDAGPCIPLESWNVVGEQYKSRLMAACREAPPGDVLKELRKTTRYGTPDANERLAAKIQAEWKEPASIELCDDELPVKLGFFLRRFTGDERLLKKIENLQMDGTSATMDTLLTGEAVLNFDYGKVPVTLQVEVKTPKISSAQEKRWKDYVGKFPKERRQPHTITVDQDKLRIEVVVNDEDGNSTKHTRVIGRKGEKLHEESQRIIDGQPGEITKVSDVPERPRPKQFPENVFSNLMRKELILGNQCTYCETLQGAYTLPQRYDQWLHDKDNTPEEFVSRDLMNRIRNAGGIDAFMTVWLDAVVAELRKDLTRLCDDEIKVKASATSSSSLSPSVASQGSKRAVKPVATDSEVEKAILASILASDKEFTNADLIKNAGILLGKAGKSSNNDALRNAVAMIITKQTEDGKIEAVAGKKPCWRKK